MSEQQLEEGRRQGNGGVRPEQRREEEASAEPAKKSRTRLRVGVGLAVVAVAGLLWWLHARKFEDTDDAQVDGYITAVSPRVTGTVSRVLVEDNQTGKQGDLLVERGRRSARGRGVGAETRGPAAGKAADGSGPAGGGARQCSPPAGRPRGRLVGAAGEPRPGARAAPAGAAEPRLREGGRAGGRDHRQAIDQRRRSRAARAAADVADPERRAVGDGELPRDADRADEAGATGERARRRDR